MRYSYASNIFKNILNSERRLASILDYYNCVKRSGYPIDKTARQGSKNAYLPFCFGAGYS